MLSILSNNYNEIAFLAEESNINWERASQLVDFSGRRITRGIELNKKYRNKVAMWCNTKVDKAGREFPFITFHCKAHGGITTVFSGYESVKENAVERSFTPISRIVSTPKPVEHKPDADEIKKQRFFETTLARYEKLPKEDGTFGYLTRKFGQRDAAFYDLDLRRDSGCIMFGIRNWNDEIIGFQQIFDGAMHGTDRNKNFIGKTSDGFIVIGDAERVKDGAIFCEGLATGLALYNAPKKRGYFSNPDRIPVVVCLDVGNMAKVVKTASLRGCKNITIAADNDISPKGNVGVYVAMKIAREIGATVIVPKNTDGTKCDFADTYNHSSHDYSKGNALAFLLELVKYAPKQHLKDLSRKLAHAIARECPKKYSIDTAVAKVNDVLKSRGFEAPLQIRAIIHREYNKRREIVRKANKLFDTQLVTHDLNGLDNDQIAQHIMENGSGFYYDDRGLGTGKTNMMIALNKLLPHDSCAYITHRIALVKDACFRFGIDNYEDVDPRFMIEKLGLCVNSAPKFNVHQRFRVLFIDEARQVIEHILSGSVENRQSVFDEFILAIQSADLVIVSDADLNDETVKFFKKYGGNKTHNLIKVDAAVNEKTLHIVADHKTNMNNVLRAVVDGHNCIVASTSIKKTVEMATYLIENQVPEEQILVINSENKGDARQAAFLLNPNEECVKYRCVIHSPTIGSGVSITTPHFAFNFLFNCGNLPANEALQMTARNRMSKNVFVSSSENKGDSRVTDIDLLIEGEGLKTARYMTMNSNGTFSPSELGQLRIDLYSRVNTDLNDFANNFVFLAEINGMTINYGRAENELDFIEAERLKGLSSRVKDKTVDDIFNSEVISELDAEQLSEKQALTQVETDKLKRHFTTKMVGLETIERDDVNNFVGGMMKVVGLYEIWQAEPSQLLTWDNENHKTKDKRYSKTSLNRLLVALFDVAASDGLTVTEKTATKFCNALKKNAAELAANGMGNYNKTFKRPMMTMSIFLKRFGLELVEDKQLGTGNRERVYLLKENKTVARYAANRLASNAHI
jgi:hypothetical protein